MKMVHRALLGSLALLPMVAYGWGDHYLITDQILEHPDTKALSTEVVKVESLDDFLKAQPNEVAAVFDEYYKWLASTGSKRFTAMKFDTANPTTAEFLHAARLNPKAYFPLVDRVMPGAEFSSEKVAPEKVSPYLKESDVFVRNFQDVTGKEVMARAVLRTFVDEPDWGMDHSLFVIKEYGYGEQPYGKPEGESSKAPFHIKFQHENFIVNKFASHVLEGMTLDRMELFSRLAKTAFATNHPYWGYRFTAWSLHYIQDLSQPYHSRAVPGKGGFYYFRYVLSFRKDKIQEKTTQVEANRHFLYEDFVSYTLQQYYAAKDENGKKLASSLQTGDKFNKPTDPKTLQAGVTEFAAEHARSIDKVIAKSFDKKMTKDPKYDQEKDPNYKATEVIGKMPPEKQDKLREETAKDFAMCSSASRSLIQYNKTK